MHQAAINPTPRLLVIRQAWIALMHLEHGWLTRHPNATVAIVLALVIFSPGVVEWML